MGGVYLEVNTDKVKASHINYLNGEYNKKKLSQRWNLFEYEGKPIKVQRDIYSALLINNVNSDVESLIQLQNLDLLRLGKLNNLSSVGVLNKHI